MLRGWSRAFMLALGLSAFTAALADAAPEQLYPGSAISTSVPTQVQMASERVVLQLIEDSSLAKSESDGQGWLVKVQADFQMKAGPKTEKMTVRFPLEDVNGGGYAYSLMARNLRAYVDGQAVKTRLVTSKTPGGETIEWAGFEVTFPAGKVTNLRITYTALPQTEFERRLVLGYILETGAGWAGQIGRADFVVRLPFAASPQTANLNLGLLGISALSGVTYSGNELRWTRQNFEPTSKDNVELAVLHPLLVKELEQARKAAQSGSLAGLKRHARASGLAISADPYDWKKFHADPSYPEFNRALKALERLAEVEPRARIEVVDVLNQLPVDWPGYSPDHPEVARALKQLEAIPGDIASMKLFATLQGWADGPLILPKARAAQSQVTPEETVQALAKLAKLRSQASPNCPDLPAQGNREAQKGYSYRSDEAAAVASMTLDAALMNYGRAWLQEADNDGPLSTWYVSDDKAGYVRTNSFSSLNGQRRFTVEIRPLYDGSAVCFRFYRDDDMFTM